MRRLISLLTVSGHKRAVALAVSPELSRASGSSLEHLNKIPTRLHIGETNLRTIVINPLRP